MLRSAITDRLRGGKGDRVAKQPPLASWLGRREDTLIIDLPHAERVRALAQHETTDSVVFQSTAVGALQVLHRVVAAERQAAEAAISLAQREKLQRMIRSLEATAGALQDTLSTQGRQMLGLCDGRPREEEAEERSWWFALTEAVEALEEGTAWMANVVSGQPKGCAARTLSSIIARQLRRHHHELLAEAEEWIT